MSKGYYVVMFDDQGNYKGVRHGVDRAAAIQNMKLWLLDTSVYGEVTLGDADVEEDPNHHLLKVPVGDKVWRIEVGPIDFER